MPAPTRSDAPRWQKRGFQSIVNDKRNLSAPGRRSSPSVRIDFAELNHRALPYVLELCGRWLPDGILRGREYIARNPRRADMHAGSFSINTSNGKWADFADPQARGNDVVSLAAYLFNLTSGQAAHRLSQAIGIEVPRE